MRAVCAHLVRLFLLLYTPESRWRAEPNEYGVHVCHMENHLSIFLSLPNQVEGWVRTQPSTGCGHSWSIWIVVAECGTCTYWIIERCLCTFSSIVFASPDRNTVIITEYMHYTMKNHLQFTWTCPAGRKDGVMEGVGVKCGHNPQVSIGAVTALDSRSHQESWEGSDRIQVSRIARGAMHNSMEQGHAHAPCALGLDFVLYGLISSPAKFLVLAPWCGWVAATYCGSTCQRLKIKLTSSTTLVVTAAVICFSPRLTKEIGNTEY